MRPKARSKHFCLGTVSAELSLRLQPFVEWSLYAPQTLWSLRRNKLLQLLCYLGYQDILTMAGTHKVGQTLYPLFNQSAAKELSITDICQQLAMSESSLRRKLAAEASSVQDIKDQVRLGHGLHLLQTTEHAVSYIAEQCGYQSQSRFASRFKTRFGLTPLALKKLNWRFRAK
ncbi:hypothetical protein tinsulaeT_06550 [Thalassotalea insulae]|uniref:HTH araC/xylS-type domain-containing protein n=1 Tax=Thalassotalea insulae TaxID=2056778 RepID=A0ABQ6GRK2_9GAMM|nr:helix-turn-helix transcriptional regulator [Thalassotalea insulae]GLX77315.1 hypothetical protein tinsulaeT_06550 [Thalassotalea insulae]